MKRLVFISCLLLIFSWNTVKGQEGVKTYLDMYSIYEGDTIAVVQLRPVHVFAPYKFKNKKDREEYTKLVRDVKATYPYAKMIAGSIIETYEYMQTIPDEKAKQKHLEVVQKHMMDTYKPKMKKMSRSQGKILIKLIDRQCNTSSYNIVKSLVGSFKAGVYNTFAGIFGNSLKTEYDPLGKDRAIEDIVIQIEEGTVDYYYSTTYNFK
ncbi:DUF4294 domain-containing protein [Dysgonomonas sp. ZJ279]|uniref:DUF4294 domain-containing protein n=1 Tax=Dysgonomonas sp. ZJ279 TaxID=2709796 RepID=UPI0013EB1850|nr:DUF4294 domain-containing protein [Dysgonomonas sp. ZJ279]